MPQAPLTQVGFRGMRDTGSSSDPAYPAILQNCYPAYDGGPLVRRSPLMYDANLTGEPLASASARFDMGDFTNAAGEHVLWVLGSTGIAASVDGATWDTSYVTTANFATAGISDTFTGRIWSVEFNGVMVFNRDMAGTPKPWSWDGTSGAGGLTRLTNGPSSVTAPPTVYYGKVFFVKPNSNEIVWCEENDATIGYEAGGYNNAWNLTQTTGDKVKAVFGTNSALYYWRQDSIGSIRGAVTPDFQASGTHDDVSQSIGIGSDGSITYAGGKIWFADAVGRPYVFDARVGSEPEPIWEQASRAFGQHTLAKPHEWWRHSDATLGGIGDSVSQASGAGKVYIESCFSPWDEQVVFWFDSTGNETFSEGIGFNVFSGQAMCWWTTNGWTSSKHTNPVMRCPTLVHYVPFSSGVPQPPVPAMAVCNAIDATAEAPVLYATKYSGAGDKFNTLVGGGATGNRLRVIGAQHATNPSKDFHAARLDFAVWSGGTSGLALDFSVQAFTPTSPTDVTSPPTALNPSVIVALEKEIKISVGLDVLGRYIQPSIAIPKDIDTNPQPEEGNYMEIRGYTVMLDAVLEEVEWP